MVVNSLATSTLSGLCTLITDGTHDTPKVLPDGVPLIKGKDISRGFIDFTSCDHISLEEHQHIIKRSKAELGDTLFANIGNSLGDVAYVATRREFSIKNVALFKPNRSRTDPRYLFYLLKSPAVQLGLITQRAGAAQPFLGLASLRSFEVDYHTEITEQHRIAAVLGAYDDLIEVNRRRAAGKTSGVIVDYVGVFQNLQKALAIYARRTAGGGPGASPIEDKEALVEALEAELLRVAGFIDPLGVSTDAILRAKGFARNALIANGVEVLVAPDDRRREFLRLAGNAVKAYKALLPDERAAPYLGPVAAIHTLSDAVKAKLGPVDISAISARISALLDEKIEGVAILTPIVEGDRAAGRVDLSAIDFEKLASLFATTPKTATAQLRDATEDRAEKMAEQNPTRQRLVERLEELVATYNAGSIDVQAFFEALKAFVHQLDEEETRAAREGLTEDELAIFDLLTKPSPALSKAQEIEVKRVARELLEKLRVLVSGVDWLRGRQSRAAVFSEIRFRLNELPEEPYPELLWNEKVNQVWDYVLQRYSA